MRDFIKQLSNEIIFAVVLFVLAYFVKNYLIKIGKKLLNPYYEKRIYKEAAKNEPPKNVNSVFEFMVMLFSIWLLVAGFKQWYTLSDLNKRTELTEKMALKNLGLRDCDKCSPVKVMKQVKDMQLEISDKKLEVVLFIFSSIVLMLNNFFKFVRRSLIYDLQIEYKQDLSKIRPFITDQEFYELNSWWAYMENANDYQLIQTRIRKIESVVKKNNRDNSDTDL